MKEQMRPIGVQKARSNQALVLFGTQNGADVKLITLEKQPVGKTDGADAAGGENQQGKEQIAVLHKDSQWA